MHSPERVASWILEGGIPEEIARELVNLHSSIQQAFLRNDHRRCLLECGFFVEATFQGLQSLLGEGRDFDEDPSFNQLIDELRSLPRGEAPESVRLLIPRQARALYTLRSKRGAHKNRKNPIYQDSAVAVRQCSWILAEFVRLGATDHASDEIQEYIRQLSTRELPVVEEFENGDLVLLEDPDSCRDAILLILYHVYPSRMETKELKAHLSEFESSNVTSSLYNGRKNNLIHQSEAGSKLTVKGQEYVESEYL